MILTIVALLVSVSIIAITLFLNFSPQFGASKKAKRTAKVLNSPNYNDGTFENKQKTVVMTDFKLSTFFEFFTDGDKVPDIPIPVQTIQADQINALADSLTRITWFGHSTVLIETAGKTIFIDPMLGEVPAPIPWFGSKRFNLQLPIEIEGLPFIDVVLISHDHYDHLDYGSIKKLKEKVGRFYAPLGVGAHLKSWGISPDKIIEMDWWDSETYDDFTFISTPARHFSGRGMFDRNSTLWCSWVIQSKYTNIFFSGDGGYGNHFKEIGDKYGPFDFTMMECGQYNEQWAQIHMLPKQIPQAQLDLKGKLLMPIHWGAFKLALHSWKEPVELLLKETEKIGMNVTTPEIGEPIILGEPYPAVHWFSKK